MEQFSSNQPTIEQPVTPPTSSIFRTRFWFTIIGTVLVTALVWTGIWWWYRENVAPLELSPTPTVSQDETSSWKTYRNDQYGFEFRYPSHWGKADNTGSGYDNSNPYLLIWAGAVSRSQCQDLGCPPKPGDRDEFTKGDTFQGAPPLNPWFEILRVHGDTWISIQVTDVNKNCSSETDCQQYLSLASLDGKTRVDNPNYQTYNDFIELISTFKFTNSADTSTWKTYRNDQYGFEFRYPEGFVLEGPGLEFQIGITSFEWNRDSYGFPYIKYPQENRFYLEINQYLNREKMSINDWINNSNLSPYESPEGVQVINVYKQMNGNLMSEKSVFDDGLQRRVRYATNSGSIELIYTYFRSGDYIYQFVSHSTDSDNLNIYNQILSTFKSTK